MTNKPYQWHEKLWLSLHQRMLLKNMPHALLFAGEPGMGKTEFVLGFAQKLLCDEDNTYACGHCKGCRLFLAHSHPDIIHMRLEEKSTQIKIDQVRKIIDFTGKTSQICSRKVIVIESVEAMNINASNALLKCLEEPAGDTLFILITSGLSRVLPTVRSRCQISILPKPSFAEAYKWLMKEVDDSEIVKLLLFFSQGNPVKALKLYENDSLTQYNVYIQQLHLLSTCQSSIISCAADIQKNNPFEWIEFLQSLLWSLIKQYYTEQQSFTLFKPLNYLLDKQNFPLMAYNLLEVIQEAKGELLGPNNPNLILLIESLLYRWQKICQMR